jgi:ABC-type dipeptide/oligopeptide/nickel transport system permease component
VNAVIGVGLGILGGAKKGSWWDRLGTFLTVGAVSLPTFWLGLTLLYVFAFQFPWFPLAGYGTLWHLVLPSLTLGLAGAASYNRLTRQGLSEALSQDYVRMARAKGLPEHVVVLRHGMRNALLPIVTLLGMDFASLLGGAVLTETVFAWPGVGYQAMQAIYQLDIPMIMGTVLFAATAIIFLNLFIDLLYRFIDPRLRRS